MSDDRHPTSDIRPLTSDLMTVTRRRMLRGAAAAAGLLWMPAIARRSSAQPAGDGVPALRGGETLGAPDFTLLRKHAPYLAGVRPHRKGGVAAALEFLAGGGKGSGDATRK